MAGDLPGARAILEKAVELGRANLSEDDPDVLLTAYHLGRVHQHLDDQAAARRVLEEAYAAGQWRFGDHDPLMVEISYDIGVVAEELGNRHEARKAFTRVAEYGPAALGATHQAVARAQAYLGQSPDSVRSSTSSTATPAALTSATEPHLTLATPVPFVPPFGEQLPGVGEPTALIEPPPPTDSIWNPPAQPTPTPAPGASAAGASQPAIGPSAGDVAYRKRGLGLFAAIAAVLASLIAVAALVFVLADRNNDPPADSDVPTLAGRAPTGVGVIDHGSEIEITWVDPSPGKVSFIVLFAHPGEEFKALTTLGPGTTSYRAGGLNARLNYCFAVAAVYTARTFATSGQSCTSRAGAGPAPSTSR